MKTNCTEPACDCTSEFHCLDYAPSEPEVAPGELALEFRKAVTIDYTNYRGERGLRLVIPAEIWFGKTEYHPLEQWLLKAFDVEKKADRDFALGDIHSLASYYTTL